jgi:hypothetical protein
MNGDKYYNENMTDKQRQVIDVLVARVEADLLDSLKNARDAYNAIIRLPAINEKGNSVLHGCNVRMTNAVQHYMTWAHQNYRMLRTINDARATEIWLANTDLFKY